MTHDRLEQALRDARHDVDAVRTAPDAWQEQQRRLAADRSHRSRLVVGAVAAAAAVVLVLVTGAVLLASGRGPDAGPPASGPQGGEDPWATENLLGPWVTFAESQTGTGTRHQGVLSDTTGEGPQLCERFVDPDRDSAAGGCSPRAENADDPGVAFDWLTGTSGGGDIAGVTVGVDDRVSFVDVWLTDGTRVALDLLDGTWEGTRLASLVVAAEGPRPQRLVASGRDGNVLQAVDLLARFGDTWLDARSACEGDPVALFGTPAEAPGQVFAAVGTGDARLSAVSSAGSYGERCVPELQGSAVAAWLVEGDRGVAVLAPEVDSIRVTAGGEALDVVQQNSVGSPWKVVELRLPAGSGQRAELIAYDAHQLELDREYLQQQATP